MFFKALIVALLALVGGDKYKAEHRALDQSAGIPKSDAKFVREFRTPKGVLVVSVSKTVPAEAVAAIERGAQMAIDRKLPGWENVKTLKDFKVYFVRPSTWQAGPKIGQVCANEETEPGSPCLIVKGTQSAGTGIGLQELSPLKLDKAGIVLPTQEGSGWKYVEYLKASAWFEGEHFVECKQGRSQPFCLYYQRVDDTHPHRP